MRKGLKTGTIIGILLLTIATLSFKSTTTDNDVNTEQTVGASTVKSKPAKSADILFDEYALSIYKLAGLSNSGLDYQVFLKGLTGYQNLKNLDVIPATKTILSVVDLSLPSTQKRLWVIDLTANKILFNTLVAHGRGSGEKMAETFSNTPSSNQSSVGFFTTAEVYTGKHGRSLRLDGLDAGLNHNARGRAIVIHGAEYVSQEVIDATGRLGRSQGCPALPMDLFSDIINDIKDNTLLFINGEGVEKSQYLKGIEQNLNVGKLAAFKIQAGEISI
ncbi:murein L,D-transpeptidase catalytic domain family protein [Daejeonella sp.]|uniref:murein L,D-transpeptidase catalytic domain family protein n=1 Tax=Daejeonella sp. TaxID=2805397 RepID=UPI003983487A